MADKKQFHTPIGYGDVDAERSAYVMQILERRRGLSADRRSAAAIAGAVQTSPPALPQAPLGEYPSQAARRADAAAFVRALEDFLL